MEMDPSPKSKRSKRPKRILIDSADELSDPDYTINTKRSTTSKRRCRTKSKKRSTSQLFSIDDEAKGQISLFGSATSCSASLSVVNAQSSNQAGQIEDEYDLKQLTPIRRRREKSKRSSLSLYSSIDIEDVKENVFLFDSVISCTANLSLDAQSTISTNTTHQMEEKHKVVCEDPEKKLDGDIDIEGTDSPFEHESDKEHTVEKVYFDAANETQTEWFIERIMARRRKDGQWQYLIKWLDWHPITSSWEYRSAINEPIIGRSFMNSFEKRLRFYEEVRKYLPNNIQAQTWRAPDISQGNLYNDHLFVWRMNDIEQRWQIAEDAIANAEIFLENWTGDNKIPSFEYTVDVINSDKVNKILKSLMFPPNEVTCKCDNGCGMKKRSRVMTTDDENICCFQRHGIDGCCYNKHGLLTECDLKCSIDVIECRAACGCDKKTCSQRVVQKGRQVAVCIFREETEKGWGVRAVDPIKQGQFVLQYVGERLVRHEAEKRPVMYQWEVSEVLPDQERFIVDAGTRGNASRFLNHSCDPNLVAKEVITDEYGPYCSRLAFFASRSIAIGEELTFNYRPNARNKSGGGTCLCGSRNCVGKIP